MNSPSSVRAAAALTWTGTCRKFATCPPIGKSIAAAFGKDRHAYDLTYQKGPHLVFPGHRHLEAVYQLAANASVLGVVLTLLHTV